MHTEEPSRNYQTRDTTGIRKVAPLRVAVIEDAPAPQRRRLPRRQLVIPVAHERRAGDRRSAKPGADGLVRTVLADDWGNGRF